MMTGSRRYRFLLFTLIFILAGSAFAGWCPETDLDENCQVGLNDLVILTHQWLNIDSCEETDNCADFDNSNNINFADFSFLAEQWAENGNYLFINEFMASNNSDSGINDPYGDYDDWIEIYNSGDMPVDLAGMYLTDTLANPTKWQIPSGSPSQTTVPAHGFVIIWADEEAAEGPLHANFKLSGSGEDLGLFYTDGVTAIDTVVFGEQTTNMAYGRDPMHNR